ncbi:uncharacterized protein LOC143180421 [Calliopsis andreniformis]|uniref:uncharacterized protein LOC143180421 n=1 Tax=Calliopsis andreniformis TaxID=337506 RepID=UPI003FCC7273
MADLVENQRLLAQRISRVVPNLKKRGKANLSLGMLRTAHTSISQMWADYTQGDASILTAARTEPKLRESSYIKHDEFSETQLIFMEQAGSLLDMIAALEAGPSDGENSNSTLKVSDASSLRSRAVLPKINLPTFEGHYKDWPSFRDLFTSLIRNDPTLSNVELLHYLKSCLTGDAAALLKNVKTTSDNFEVAWSKLDKRFSNLRLLVQAQIRTLNSLAPLKRESASGMRRLFDGTFDVIDALSNLGRPVTNATDWIVELTVERWDRQSRREWEDSLNQSTQPPTLEQLKTFMEGRIRTCDALESPQHDEPSESKKLPGKSIKVHLISKAGSQAKSCSLCQGRHYVLFCSLYKEKTPADRRESVRSLGLCFNCLGKHSVSECKSNKRCQKCERKHHTTLHDAASSSKDLNRTGASVQQISTRVSQLTSALLGTARVRIFDAQGQNCISRSLIDPGSEVSLISEALAQRLRVKRSHARIPLLGVGGARARFTRGKTTLLIAPHFGGEVRFEVPVYIIPELSQYGPRNQPSPAVWSHVQGLALADPACHLADPIDVLLGADAYSLILREGVKRGPPNAPVAQETALGWILTGGTVTEAVDESGNPAEVQVRHCSVDKELLEFLTRFWEQEEIEVTIPETADDRRAEEHFTETHLRQPDGRFLVRLPFRSNPEWGNSRRIACRTLESLKSRFRRSAGFQQAYAEFMESYDSLGHMTSLSHPVSGDGYYLPHHGVFREAGTTTKLRVVFNGSMPSSNGRSLNEFLLRGPNLLPNLADVLLRWRRYVFVFSADIEKMYRQILVHPEDRKWQRIVWKPTPDSTVVDYELNTVTYGLACAPYLAIRCLRQLAEMEEQRYPRGAQIIRSDIYVDDVLTGADTLPEAMLRQQELRELLTAGGFPLRKWASNSKSLLDGLASDELRGVVEWDSPTLHSVLGIKWIPSSDCFQVTTTLPPRSSGCTKRSVLSGTAQLFDPLGWMAPVTIVAKVLIQTLWLLKADWDSPLPEREALQWQQFQRQLPALEKLQVPRWLGTGRFSQSVEVHGFADASERAYAAVVYSRTFNSEGAATVSLMVAKSKVAPLKRVSLPRLELCAAHLLAKLVEHTTRVLEWQDVDLHLWSDSTVALSWIQGHPSRWSTYVANRVAKIQGLLPRARWHHVRGSENPADCASRGLLPAELSAFQLWWRGPEWLSSLDQFPESILQEEPRYDAEELNVHHMTQPRESSSSSLIRRFSSLTRLFRVLAWCRRWLPGSEREMSVITASDVHTVKLTLFRLEQAAAFSEDILNLQRNQPVAAKSRLIKLNPFLDTSGVLRVGGRIQAANLPYDQTHPAILPDESPLAKFYTAPGVLDSQRSGIDYAGPIHLRVSRGRGQQSSKGYIAVFICLSTKAVHLEAVSDGSTETFLAALRRFISRRGRCAEICSDCGRNFVGANHELRALLRQSVDRGGGPFAAASREGISWKFNPPSAPHFGGIWEAAVKSVKHHLRRIIGEQRLSFEELTTLLTGIEACLNSRPLQPLTDDPGDPAALTPGHFLIGEPLTAIPEPSLEDLPAARLSRWQLIQQLQQHFWRRWSREYLNTLQTRGKWKQNKHLIKAGFLCLVKNELLPPTQWPLARVVRVHPGPDGSIRVATVRTSTSHLLRPVHKLIPLFAPENEEKNDGGS